MKINYFMFILLSILMLSVFLFYIYTHLNNVNKVKELKNQTSMQQISPEAQKLISEYNDLKNKYNNKLIPGFTKVNFTAEEKELLSKMNDIGIKLKEYENTKRIQALVSANINDCDIKIKINDKDIGINDESLGQNRDGDSVTLLRNSDSIMKSISSAPNEVFVLNQGRNTISVNFKKKNPNNPLRVKILSYNDDEIINISSDKNEGVIEKEFDIYDVKPDNFTTVNIKD